VGSEEEKPFRRSESGRLGVRRSFDGQPATEIVVVVVVVKRDRSKQVDRNQATNNPKKEISVEAADGS
jgi:hypothetical protein